MDPVRRGQRAAWKLFAVAFGVYVAAAIVIRVAHTDPTNCGAEGTCGLWFLDRTISLAIVAVLIGGLGLLGARTISEGLPTPESKRAFWLTGLLCMALSGLLWFPLCWYGMR